jgi:hypothetical protein
MVKHTRPSRWVHELLRPEAVLGAVALSVQPWLLTIRAGDLTQSLMSARIADRSLVIVLFGTHYTMGTCAITGAALTVAQMIAASVYTMESPPSKRRRHLKYLSGSGWIILSVLELASTVLCAHRGLREQATALVLALLLLLFESCAGILIIDCLVVPAALAMGWTIHRVITDAFAARLSHRSVSCSSLHSRAISSSALTTATMMTGKPYSWHRCFAGPQCGGDKH